MLHCHYSYELHLTHTSSGYVKEYLMCFLFSNWAFNMQTNRETCMFMTLLTDQISVSRNKE